MSVKGSSSTWGLLLQLATVLVLLGAPAGRAQQPESRRDFMRKKLEYSKNVLEGLSVEDFAMIAKNAKALKAMSEAAAWRDSMIPNVKDYLPYTIDFQRQTDDLLQAAEKRNLDGASLAYIQTTLTCVRCHKYARFISK